MRKSWQLYLLILPPLVYLAIFSYWPLYGSQIAFREESFPVSMTDGRWVGFQHIMQFMGSFQFWTVVRNTLVLSFYELIAIFPLPILLALGINAARSSKVQRIVQIVTYAPHFLSTVVVAGIVIMLLSPSGLANGLLAHTPAGRVDFLGEGLFRHTFVWSGAWQTMGYSAIIFLAALASVDPQLHEAARVDGAGILRRIFWIDLPAILPVIATLFVLHAGTVLSVGFEKVLLLQNPLNTPVSEVIDTYAYKVAFVSSLPQYSYGAAIGLFKSVLSLALLLTANMLARRVAKHGLF